MHRLNPAVAPAAVLLLITAGCLTSVNGPINIRDGSEVHDTIATVNGSISIGADCVVTDGVKSVNGAIRVGPRSELAEVQAVNGTIRLGRGTQVRRDVESVNGSITSEDGVLVEGELGSINGEIELTRTRVRRDVYTYTGDITLRDATQVSGDVVVKRNRGHSDRSRPLIIRIEDGSVVGGDVLVVDLDVRVEVHLVRGGRVDGDIRGATVIKDPPSR